MKTMNFRVFDASWKYKKNEGVQKLGINPGGSCEDEQADTSTFEKKVTHYLKN
jgi:hypothetical protein